MPQPNSRRQLPENAGGKGGTRTLDPGIMRSDDEEQVKELQEVAWSVVQLSAVCGPGGHKKWHTGFVHQLSTLT